MIKDKTLHNLHMGIFWLEAPLWKRLLFVHLAIYIVSFIVWALFFHIDFLHIYSSIQKEYGIGIKGGYTETGLYLTNPALYNKYLLHIWLWIFSIPLIYPAWLELKFFIRRKKLGTKLEEEIEKLKMMKKNYESNQFNSLYGDNNTRNSENTHKTDIGYWYELLQKGAITEEEYNKKKEELL